MQVCFKMELQLSVSAGRLSVNGLHWVWLMEIHEGASTLKQCGVWENDSLPIPILLLSVVLPFQTLTIKVAIHERHFSKLLHIVKKNSLLQNFDMLLRERFQPLQSKFSSSLLFANTYTGLLWLSLVKVAIDDRLFHLQCSSKGSQHILMTVVMTGMKINENEWGNWMEMIMGADRWI